MRSVVVIVEPGVAKDVLFARLGSAGLLTATFHDPHEVARLATRIEAVFGFVSAGAELTRLFLEALDSVAAGPRRPVVLVFSGTVDERRASGQGAHIIPPPHDAGVALALVQKARETGSSA